MKKIHYISLIATLLLTGCNGHPAMDLDTQKPSGSYIFFDADIYKTKGNLVDGESLPGAAGTAFGVFGYRAEGTPIFSTYADSIARVYRNTQSGPFIYDNLALWHNGDHSFYAYYPYDSQGITSIETNPSNPSNPYLTYVQPTDLEAMIDVMTAVKSMNSSDNGEVVLEFKHRLFAFGVVLRNNHLINDHQPEETVSNLRITDAIMQFHDITATASLYFDNTITLADTTTNISKDFVAEQFIVSSPPVGGNSVEHNFNDDEGPFLLLPCTSIQISFTLKYINAWNEECTYQISNLTLEPEGGFLQGHEYALIIDKECSNNEITFVASLQDYTDDNKIEINIEYN